MNFKFTYYLFLIFPFFHLILFQLKNLKIDDPSECLAKFKSNNYLGLIVFINILIGKII